MGAEAACGRGLRDMSPPWERAMSRAIVSPSPVPPVAALRDGSRRKNGLNTCSR